MSTKFNWAGTLTRNNIFVVTQLLGKLLNDKTYKYTRMLEAHGFNSEVIPHEQLVAPVQATKDRRMIILQHPGNCPWISIIPTKTKVERFDPTYDNAYITIFGNQITFASRQQGLLIIEIFRLRT